MAAVQVTVIGDDEIALGLREDLKSAGYEVSATVSSPDEAIEKAKISSYGVVCMCRSYMLPMAMRQYRETDRQRQNSGSDIHIHGFRTTKG